MGDTIESEPRVISLEDIDHFADFTGDTFYAHTDPEAAAHNPLFGGIVAHGYLIVSMAAGLNLELLLMDHGCGAIGLPRDSRSGNV